eukprot:CAMPEP_0174838222 /NCGR_PEP_ID=MMETSP1114-20130205/7262_1 /TAXON_ID=312471 /ORGANISM="Neobodo designis, Strain CCAP 1951/1" /LENGTH=339 /DNA_ID=CAMNT_0016072317 /DNA_START=77 /DNA_END=1096 /DNA_ORIENTATION=+
MTTPAGASPKADAPDTESTGDFLAHFRSLSRDEQVRRVSAEFSQLQRLDHVPTDAMDATFHTAVSTQHRDKNRYCDVLANERTLFPPRSTGKYINGNLLAREKFGGAGVSFVACQAPTPKFIGEFLEVVAASKTPLIVNLTKNVEGGRTKAHQYWPNRVGETLRFGNTSVTLLSEDPPASKWVVVDTTLRKLRIDPPGHEVTLAHYEGWPDMGVPQTADGVHSIISHIENVENPADAPIFVHCSAGIGRTGTLIAAYFARQMLRAGTLADDSIVNIVAGLKQARCGMVQRREQFAFVYQCVLEDIANLPGGELARKAPRSEKNGARGDDDDDVNASYYD